MTARESSTVWVVVIEANDCENLVRVFATDEAADTALYAYVCAEWSHYCRALSRTGDTPLDTPPTDYAEAIDLYFEAMSDHGEFYHIYDREIES